MIERGKFAVFIEGVRLPFIAASVNLAPNKFTTATISLPASFDAPRIIPFSMVQIFYWDQAANKGKGDWFLLWEGVTIGHAYSKTPAGAGYTITCADFFVYMHLTTVALFDHTYFDFNYRNRMAVFGQAEFIMKMQEKGEWADKYFLPSKGRIELGKRGTSLLELTKNFLKNWAENFPLLDAHMQRCRFSKKFCSVVDNTIQMFFNEKKLYNYLAGNLDNWAGNTNVLGLFTQIMNIIYYNYVNIGPCIYKDGSLRQIVLKPSTYFLTPPRCNIIFPDVVTSMNNSIDHLTSSTRSLMSTVVGMTNLFVTYFAPMDLRDYMLKTRGLSYNQDDLKKIDLTTFDEMARKLSDKEEGDAVASEEVCGTKTPQKTYDDANPFKTYYTKEEIEGTIIAKNVQLDRHLAHIDTEPERGYNTRLAILSDYFHYIYKYANNTVSLTLKFSPQLVCDFPAIYLDKHGSIIGNIVNITHNINANGTCFTAVSMNLARDLREDTEDLPIPRFTAQAYSNKLRLNSTYMDLLGCPSIAGSHKNTKDEKKETKTSRFLLPIAKIINEVFNLSGESTGEYYHAVAIGKVMDYIYKYTQREKLATIEDVKKHYGLETETRSLEDGSDEEWKWNGSGGISPYDYQAVVNLKLVNYLDKITYQKLTKEIKKDHKKEMVKFLKTKYKGIIDGR